MIQEEDNPGLKESLDQIKTGVIEHMNDDHSDANVIVLAVQMPGGVSEVRVDFLKPLTKAEDIRPALIKLLKYARERL